MYCFISSSLWCLFFRWNVSMLCIVLQMRITPTQWPATSSPASLLQESHSWLVAVATSPRPSLPHPTPCTVGKTRCTAPAPVAIQQPPHTPWPPTTLYRAWVRPWLLSTTPVTWSDSLRLRVCLRTLRVWWHTPWRLTRPRNRARRALHSNIQHNTSRWVGYRCLGL